MPLDSFAHFRKKKKKLRPDEIDSLKRLVEELTEQKTGNDDTNSEVRSVLEGAPDEEKSE